MMEPNESAERSQAAGSSWRKTSSPVMNDWRKPNINEILDKNLDFPNFCLLLRRMEVCYTIYENYVNFQVNIIPIVLTSRVRRIPTMTRVRDLRARAFSSSPSSEPFV